MPSWNSWKLSPEIHRHYTDVIMGAMASQITSLTIVYSTVYSSTDQKKISKLRVICLFEGSHRGPVNSPHKWPVTRKMFPFDDVIMMCHKLCTQTYCFALFELYFQGLVDLRGVCGISHDFPPGICLNNKTWIKKLRFYITWVMPFFLVIKFRASLCCLEFIVSLR